MRIGQQKPRRKVSKGEVTYTDGEDVALLSAELGLNLFEWQRDIINDWCSRSIVRVNGEDDVIQPTYITCGLDVPRQNGKNAALEAYEVYVLSIKGWHVLHTAHRVKTTKKAFYRLAKYFTNKRFLKMLREYDVEVTNIRRTNGEEAIELSNGARIEFASRTTGSARGYDDIQLCVYDEAQELTNAQFQSIDFSLSASTTDGGARQKIFTGTPPYEGCNGTVFARQRAAAFNVTPNRTTWSSWATERLPRKDARWEDVIEEVYNCNPSMGVLLDIEYTETEFAGSTILAFAQERLDWWTPLRTADHAIPEELWKSTQIEAIADKYPGKVAFGVKFAPDGSYATVVGCKMDAQAKKAAVEYIDTWDMGAGTKRLAEWLNERRAKASCVCIDGMNGADALCDSLWELQVPRGYVVRPNTSEVISAAVNLMDGLKQGALAHTPNDELDRSAVQSVRRAIGKRGGWGFGSTETASSIAIEAAALAYNAARKTRRDPKRKQKLL